MTWQLTRNDTSASLRLPEDLHWKDEFNWSSTAQSAPVYLLSGAVDIQQGTKSAGRPITLTGDWVWLKRSELATLRAWTDVPELTLTLTHPDGRTFTVMWRLHDAAIQAMPVHYQTPEADDEPYTATLSFMTI